MSTATTIQAHTAYEMIDGNPDSAYSDLSKYHYSVRSANDGALGDTASNNVAMGSDAKGARVVSGLTLEDFGGRSDALGG